MNVQSRGGGECLPKFKFSAKFPIGLHLILKLQIKKFKTCLNQMCRIILTKKSVGVTAVLYPSLNSFEWALFSNYTALYAFKGHISAVLPH